MIDSLDTALVASTAEKLGYSGSTIGAMLEHAGGTIISRYVYHLHALLIAALDQVQDRLLPG